MASNPVKNADILVWKVAFDQRNSWFYILSGTLKVNFHLKIHLSIVSWLELEENYTYTFALTVDQLLYSCHCRRSLDKKKEYLNGLCDLRWSTTTKKRVWVNQRHVLPVKFVALPRTAVVEEREGGGGGSWAKQPLVFPDLRNVVGERAGAFHHKGVYKITASSAKYNIPHKHTYVAIFNWF